MVSQKLQQSTLLNTASTWKIRVYQAIYRRHLRSQLRNTPEDTTGVWIRFNIMGVFKGEIFSWNMCPRWVGVAPKSCCFQGGWNTNTTLLLYFRNISLFLQLLHSYTSRGRETTEFQVTERQIISVYFNMQGEGIERCWVHKKSCRCTTSGGTIQSTAGALRYNTLLEGVSE